MYLILPLSFPIWAEGEQGSSTEAPNVPPTVAEEAEETAPADGGDAAAAPEAAVA